MSLGISSKVDKWICPICQQSMLRGYKCPKCGTEEPNVADDTCVDASGSAPRDSQPVIITGVNIPIFDLVSFTFKLALAAIPAVIVFSLFWWMIARMIIRN